MAFKSTAIAVTTLILSTSADAAYFNTTINVGQTLAVSPSDATQVIQHSGAIDLPSLVGVPDLFSGAYNINWGYIQFNFNQQAHLANTPEDLVFTGSYSYVQSAQNEQLMVGNEQYNYVVDFMHDDYYYDQRIPAEAIVDINQWFSSPTSFYTNYTYEFNREEFIVPPDTTGVIERHNYYDAIDRLDDLGDAWFDFYSLYGGNGIVDYTATATNGILDLESIFIDLDYQSVAAPIPAAVWLFGSGLIGLIGLARRKQSV